MTTKAQKAAEDREAARLQLLGIYLEPGDTVYTIMRSVSRSGMKRVISVVVPMKDADRPVGIVDITGPVGVVTGRRREHAGIVCNGVGMDMGFDLVYALGLALWPNGTPGPHGMRNGEPDSAGGYALHHRWL